MQIGDSVTFQGRRYVVVGFTPFSVDPFRVELEDEETGESNWFSWPPPDEVERAASRFPDAAREDGTLSD